MNTFTRFRENIVGSELVHALAYGPKRIVYADWTASGRLYRPIEEYILNTLGPYVANTHTTSNATGRRMTEAYHDAQDIIKQHVHADEGDVLMFSGFGMTAVVNKLQRMLGLRMPEKCCRNLFNTNGCRPLVIVTHMEHHSNQITWNECCCDVVILNRMPDGLPDLAHLEKVLLENTTRKLKIGAFTAASNVTGIITPYHAMAAVMHRHGGYCFVDFSAAAPYLDINMHPEDPAQRLDAIYFSPHKFLGGPGSSGVLVMNSELYRIRIPDQPGGGTVKWTNPWREQRYYDDIETREDGGTPGFLQAIRAALAIVLKEEMGAARMMEREHLLLTRLVRKLERNPAIHILEPQQMNRLGIVSFYVLNRHYNLIVKLLNDHFGIQTRGGCSCAGTYGHILLNVDRERSQNITAKIDQGDLSDKPGWTRISLHPTMTEADVDYIADALHQTLENFDLWAQDYTFNSEDGEFYNRKPETPFPALRAGFTP